MKVKKAPLKHPHIKVAVDRTSPHGLVVGIDVIPAKPPPGVSTIQGNFLSAAVQDGVKKFLRGAQQGKSRRQSSSFRDSDNGLLTENELASDGKSYLEQEKQSGVLAPEPLGESKGSTSIYDNVDDGYEDPMVDVVLSDMSAPWEQTDGFWKRSLSNPYYRMMNTSGINFRDHAGSMDLCEAASKFAFDTLRPNGHLVCKFYQGSEDTILEARLKRMFSKVHRDKPESSRNVCQYSPSRDAPH
ncbi:MAG: hypothetical protein LQ343_003751 [Gyalolechia ehrenbergii]|nr:MAG: hypothetical protein LQ343_003751 [Gyalolechia ehrenbergii]